jgi:elongation factor G
MMKDRLSCNAVPIQLPIGTEDDFCAIIDLVKMVAYFYMDDDGNKIEERPIPDDMMEKAQEYRTAMVEAAAEQDDALMEKYFKALQAEAQINAETYAEVSKVLPVAKAAKACTLEEKFRVMLIRQLRR